MESFLFVGVGGSGGKTLRALKRNLIDILEHQDYDVKAHGFPSVWQFVNIDTPYLQKAEGFPADLLSADEYLGLAEKGVEYDALMAYLRNNLSAEPGVLEEILSPLPSAGMIHKSVDEGAGQYRAVGRAVAIARLRQMRDKLERSFAMMQGADAESDLVRLRKAFGVELTGKSKTRTFLVSSIAGGSGAGQFLDVSEAIKAASIDASGDDQMAILFAPDVFEDRKISQKGGIAPNSLAAISELVNGRWRRARTEISKKLYEDNGFRDQGGNYNPGPKHIFLVGAKNEKVSFSGQHDIYESVAMSLAKLVTDQSLLEDLTAFAMTNDQSVPDPFGVKLDNWMPHPLNSLGFARVTLGLDIFSKYSRQRLARYTVESLLDRHAVSEDPQDAKLTDKDLTRKKARTNAKNFLNALDLEIATVVEQIQPVAKQSKLLADYKENVTKRLTKDQATAAEWVESISNAVQVTMPTFQQRWVDERNISTWAGESQARVLRVVAEYSVKCGIKVTQEMLALVVEKLKKDSADFRSDLAANPLSNLNSANMVSSIRSLLTSSLNGSGQFKKDAILDAASQATDKIGETWRHDTKSLAHHLLVDLADNLLRPVATSIGQTHESLDLQRNNDDFQDTGINLVKSWPKASVVSALFKPAENVRVLIDWESFPERFREKITENYANKVPGQIQTFEESLQSAAIDIAVGSSGIEEHKLGFATRSGSSLPDGMWETFSVSQSWKPGGIAGQDQQRWSGIWQSDVTQWEEFARKFVQISSRPIGKDIATSLYKWVNVEDPAERAKREEALLSEFKSALEISKPFAQIDSTLFALSPSNAPTVEIAPQFSEIAVDLNDQDSTLGRRMREMIVNAGYEAHGLEKKFVGERGGNEIDIFATFKQNLNFFEFVNLTEPILRSWQTERRSPAGRQAFMLSRRTRNLPETLPVAPEVAESILRGWYVAKLLNRLQQSETSADLGTKIDVWQSDPMVAKFESLPYPLYTWQRSVPAKELPAVVLDSVRIALAECANLKSRAPYSPYLSLINLGGFTSLNGIKRAIELGASPRPDALGDALTLWLREGRSQDKAPMPLPERAGDGSGTVASRARIAQDYFRKELESFNHSHVDRGPGVPHDSLGYEIRREVTKALEDLIALVAEAAVDESGI